MGSGPGRKGGAWEEGPGRGAGRVNQKTQSEADLPACRSCSYYNTTSVLLCLGITALVCLSVTVFSFQTKVSSGACGQVKAEGVGAPSIVGRGKGMRRVWEATWCGRGRNAGFWG